MAIIISGNNTQKNFENNRNKFEYCESLQVYKQTSNPMISYSDNKKQSSKIKDTFAYYAGEDNYIIFDYIGSNFIEDVKKEIASFIQQYER